MNIFCVTNLPVVFSLLKPKYMCVFLFLFLFFYKMVIIRVQNFVISDIT